MESSDLHLPPIASVPSDQHAQTIYALGLLRGEMQGMRIEMEGLKDAKLIQNGRVGTLEKRMTEMEVKQATSNGESDGVSKTWTILFTVAGLLVGALAVYVTIKH